VPKGYAKTESSGPRQKPSIQQTAVPKRIPIKGAPGTFAAKSLGFEGNESYL